VSARAGCTAADPGGQYVIRRRVGAGSDPAGRPRALGRAARLPRLRRPGGPGTVRPGQQVLVLPEGTQQVTRWTPRRARWTPPEWGAASPYGSPTTWTVARGSVIVDAAAPPTVTDELEATLAGSPTSRSPRCPAAAPARHPGHPGRSSARCTTGWTPPPLPGSGRERLEDQRHRGVSIRTADRCRWTTMPDSRGHRFLLLIDPRPATAGCRPGGHPAGADRGLMARILPSRAPRW